MGGGVWVLDSPVVVVVVSRVGCRGWGRVGCWWWTGSGLISGRNGPPTLVGCCKKNIVNYFQKVSAYLLNIKVRAKK